MSVVETGGVLRVSGAPPASAAHSRTRRGLPVLGLFALGLELAMFTPLLRPGTVWLLDSPSYLMGTHPTLPDGSWAGAPWQVVRGPFETALASIYRFLPWGQVRLLPLLVVPALATFGFHLLFGEDRIATIGGSLLYVVNPFVYERMLAGQEYFLVGVASLPLLVALVVRARSAVKTGIGVGVLLAALATISPHLAFVGGLLLAGLIASGLINRARTLTIASAVALGIASAVTLAWAIPAGSVGQSAAATLDAQLFRTAADSRLGLLPNAIGMYGFWRQGWPLAKESLSTWPLILAAIIVVAGSGAVSVRRSRFRAPILGIGLAGLAGLLLALGDRGPTGAVYSWLYREAPWFRVMREPQKFLVLLVLAYAVMFGLGVSALVRGTSSRRARVATLLVLLALPCVYSFRSFWGFAGYVHPSLQPTSWAEADAAMGDGPGAVLVLPWHRYLPFPWTQYRVVASPLASAFSRPAIVSDDPEFGTLGDLATDPRARSIGPLLRSGASKDRFGGRVASLGVAYVVLTKVEDWHADDWLYRRSDLELVGDWNDLAVFRVTPRGAPG